MVSEGAPREQAIALARNLHPRRATRATRARRPVVAALPAPLQFLVLAVAAWMNAEQAAVIDYLRAELRSVLESTGRKQVRLTATGRRRIATAAMKISRRVLAQVASVANPDTILRWYRELVAAKYDGAKKRLPGRPRRAAEIRRLIVTMAMENGKWGYTRIRGALRNLGHEIGRNTIKRVLREEGLDPAPERGRQTPWASFIEEHLGAIAAADFFNVEVLTWKGLVRFYVFFVIDIATRKVEIAGISRSPDGLWMDQIARNLVDVDDGFLLGA